MDGQCDCGHEGEGTVGGRRRKTALFEGNSAETSTPHRSWKKMWRKRKKQA